MNSKGFTIIESLIVLTVISVGVTLAMPGWNSMVEKRSMHGAVNEIVSFLTYARSQAVMTNEQITVTVKRGNAGANWCFGAVNEAQKDANDLDHCDCDSSPGQTAHCSVDGQTQLISNVGFEGVTLDGLFEDSVENDAIHFSFGPVSGLKLSEDGSTTDLESHVLKYRSSNSGYQLQLEISVTGHVSICSPDPDQALPPFYTCSGVSTLAADGLEL